MESRYNLNIFFFKFIIKRNTTLDYIYIIFNLKVFKYIYINISKEYIVA